MRAWFLVAALLLAGCTGGEKTDSDDFGVEVTASSTTGAIRGVVVDGTLNPIAGALVSLEGTGRNTTTTDVGAFGFSDVEPGTYFLRASKIGFQAGQTDVTVVAGVAAPEARKILLTRDPSSTPDFEVFKWEGFIECSARAVAYGVALCQGVGNDDVVFDYELDKVPTFAQGELVWQSTQALGDALSFNWRKTGTNADYIDTEGSSPLRLRANQTLLEANDVGAGQPLRTVIFTAHNEATEPPCQPPVPCLWGVGVQLQQSFTMYGVVFYNFEPAEDYWYIEAGDPVPPS